MDLSNAADVVAYFKKAMYGMYGHMPWRAQYMLVMAYAV